MAWIELDESGTFAWSGLRDRDSLNASKTHINEYPGRPDSTK